MHFVPKFTFLANKEERPEIDQQMDVPSTMTNTHESSALTHLSNKARVGLCVSDCEIVFALKPHFAN